MTLTEMRERLQDLSRQLSDTVQAGLQLVSDSASTEQINANNNQAAALSAQIQTLRNGIAQMEGQQRADMSAQTSPAEDASATARRDQIRASREYSRAFFSALANGYRPGDALRYSETYKPLMDVLTIGGGDPAGEQGGFVVPVDMETNIIRLVDEMNPLRQYFHVENVTTNSGTRVIERGVRLQFERINEAGATPVLEDPAHKLLRQISYTLGTYRKIIPLSQELVSDAAAMQRYCELKLAEAKVATENANLLALLAKLTPTTVAADEPIHLAVKHALDKTLRRAISRRAMILTNATGYSLMDEELDGNLRPILQPDPTQATADRLCGRALDYVDDADMADLEAGAPVYIGDFASYGVLFDRGAMQLDATTVGGDAWRNYGLELRAVMRQDYQVYDDTAACALALAAR